LRYFHAKGRAVTGVTGRAVTGVVGSENSEAAVSKDVTELERESSNGSGECDDNDSWNLFSTPDGEDGGDPDMIEREIVCPASSAAALL
jgi:hypothetical protein